MRKHWGERIAGYFLAAVGIAAPVSLVRAQPPQVVQARLMLATHSVHAGSLVRATVAAEIAPGYHINAHKPSADYLIPTDLKIKTTPQVLLVSAEYPKVLSVKFAFADQPLLVYEGKIAIGAKLRITASARPGSYPLTGELSYQACNDHACLPPASAPFSLTLHVVPSYVPSKRRRSDTSARPHPVSTALKPRFNLALNLP